MRFLSCNPQTNAINKFFDDDFLAQLSAQTPWVPALDVIEEKDQFVLRADLPGIKKEDIKVDLEDNILTLKAERKSETESQDKQYHRIERTYGHYQRSLNLGQQIDASKIKAVYKDGVLELIVPKSEQKKPQTIEVQVN